MRTSLFALVVALSASTGCVSAIRKVEQALNREKDKAERPERASNQNRPAAAAEVRFAVKPDHPRLFATGDWPKPADDVAVQWRALLTKRANEIIDKPQVDYSPKKMLTRSREALKRISALSGVYRFTGDRKYAEAGRRELLNVCGFEDWQPNDFLATAEMMNAVAIGYDWLYDTLSPADRRTVSGAIVEKGLKPAMDAYASQGGWTTARHNWNLVCNGGVIVASLAVANEEPAISRRALGYALASIEEGMAAYDEHGGTAEGPMYHSYATRYLTFAAAALETAASDNRLVIASPSRPDRESKSGETSPTYRSWMFAAGYRMTMTGPSGKVANFGDCSEYLGNTAWVLWPAGTFHDDEANAFQAAADRDEPSVFDLLWYNPQSRNYVQSLYFSSQPNAAAEFGSAIVLRGDPKDRLSPFLALRTGSTADHHSHLDLGNFVLDMLGERFAQDLGADNYDLPGYLGPRRADYLRSSTPGHNTLSIGNASQPGDAVAKASLAAGGRSAMINMTEAYPGAKSVVRTIGLDRGRVTVTDTLRVKRDLTIIWNLHTPAKVKLTRGGAILDSNGKRVTLNIVEPRNAKFTAEPDQTRPPELPIDGVTHLRLRVPIENETKIVIEFVPAGG